MVLALSNDKNPDNASSSVMVKLSTARANGVFVSELPSSVKVSFAKLIVVDVF